MRHLTLHFFAQPAMEIHQLVDPPFERRDRVGELEEGTRQVVAHRLVAAQGGVVAANDGVREQFGIAQRIGEAVRGDRIR